MRMLMTATATAITVPITVVVVLYVWVCWQSASDEQLSANTTAASRMTTRGAGEEPSQRDSPPSHDPTSVAMHPA